MGFKPVNGDGVNGTDGMGFGDGLSQRTKHAQEREKNMPYVQRVGMELVSRNDAILKAREALSKAGNRPTQQAINALIRDLQSLPTRGTTK